MKKSVLLLFFSACAASGLSDLEKNFIGSYASPDAKTRLTAFLLTAEIRSDSLRGRLRDALKKKSGVEKTAILYALNSPAGTEETKTLFVHSISTDSAYLRELIAVEIGERSYVKGPPYLHILELLGKLAVHDDNALKKLLWIYPRTDGWIAESIFALIETARMARLNREMHNLRLKDKEQ